MTYTVVIAGLSPLAFDRLRKESENRIAPGGRVVLTPNTGSGVYAKQHGKELIAQAHKIAARLDESKQFTTLLLYTDFQDESTKRLLEDFFPFCLPLAIPPFVSPADASKRIVNEQLNAFTKAVLSASARLRSRSRVVSDFTTVANLTPLLLPHRNFRSDALDRLLRHLYGALANADDPKTLVRDAVKRFFAECPMRYAPGQDQHCFSDGHLYFQSPGRNRHGFFRNNRADDDHSPTCLLNARSRLGGPYDYKFHYDCIPAKGSLRSEYGNCHSTPCAPKSTHVNIAPNDYIV